jgi:hypothetical protein
LKKQDACVVGAVLIPILSFYAILLRETVNIPFLDDYGGVLGFVSAWSQLSSAREKILAILTTQHNEYKLIFADAVYAFQYATFRNINFAVLSVIGNLLLLPLYLVIYRMWADRELSGTRTLSLFIPVSWIFFQLQYYSLLNWPMSSLQHIAVVLFSLLTIYLLGRDELGAFYLSLPSLFMAVASSGNGFFLIPVGCLMLVQFRRPLRLIVWLLASVAILALYLYRYNFYASTAHANHSIVASLHHISPLYSLSFLGASIAKYGSYVPSAILGLGFCGVFVYAIVDKLYLRMPAIFYSMCFILITSLAVSGLRSDFGIAQSLVSRYRIYSNLMLVFCYLYCIEKLYRPQAQRDRVAAGRLTAMLTVGAVLFNVGSDYAGFRLLHARTELTKEGLYRWEEGQPPLKSEAGHADENPVIGRQRLSGNYDPEDSQLRQAIRLGIYAPPVYGPSNP